MRYNEVSSFLRFLFLEGQIFWPPRPFATIPSLFSHTLSTSQPTALALPRIDDTQPSHTPLAIPLIHLLTHVACRGQPEKHCQDEDKDDGQSCVSDPKVADALGVCIWKDGRNAQMFPRPKGGPCQGPPILPRDGETEADFAVRKRNMCPLADESGD